MFAHTVAALVVLPFVAQFAAAASCSRSYTVQAGDTCDAISAAQNVSTYQLAVVNEGQINAACTNLSPGQQLCLGYAGEDCSTTYVVQPNDDCDIITSAVGINSTLLYLNNPQINQDCTNVYVGEVLCTGNTVQVPPAPSGSVPAATIPATATPAIPSSAPSSPAPPTSAAPSSAPPSPASPSSAAPSASATESDDDLPYCDEL